MALVGQMKILIPLAGLIDKDAERKRLVKERDRSAAEVARIENKLANPNFVDKAPPAVVAKVRERLATARSAVLEIERQIAKIGAL